jgi:hypothetical protein
MVDNGVGLSDLLLWRGLHHCAQPKSPPVQSLGHRTGRGPLVRTIPVSAQGFQRRWRRQSRRGQGGSTCWGLWRVRFRQPGQGCCSLGRCVFPAFAAAEGRLRPETPDPCASFGKTPLNGMTTPPEDGFGQQRGAPTIFQGHLSLKGPSCRSRHFGGRQAHISARRRTKRLMGCQRRVLHAHNMTS